MNFSSTFRINHLVFIGINYQPERATGDKNFWVDLVAELSFQVNRITILSIRQEPIPETTFQLNQCQIRIKYLSPKLLQTSVQGKSERGGEFSTRRGVLEKFLNINRIMQELTRIAQSDPFQHIHLLDNLGYANRAIAKFQSASGRVTVSAMAYQGKTPRWVYERYLRLSYRHPNLTVVPYSQAYAQKLGRFGIEPDRICRIPWGVKVSETKVVNESDKKTLKSAMQLQPDVPLILWAGYLQQLRKNDFITAYRLAQNLLNSGLNAQVYFAFKPECFDSQFAQLHQPEKKIWVQSTAVGQFEQLCGASDIFYSPFFNQECIIAPPLTWLEMLNRGNPIVSTSVPGAEEVIIPGETGYLCRTESDLVDGLTQAIARYKNMRTACINLIKTKYNIQDIAKQYLALFNGSPKSLA